MSDAALHEGEFVVASELGLHARPAGLFVTLADRFDAEIKVGRGGEWVDGRSVLSLLSLAASKGTRLCVRAVGPDAREAVAALGALLERGPATD
ncbi:MAG TPA: HPr family phosphocarrier protein [Myxococcota bacterium]|nr:HPr family phosphocarrier protein [Myxococcota bacterium]